MPSESAPSLAYRESDDQDDYSNPDYREWRPDGPRMMLFWLPPYIEQGDSPSTYREIASMLGHEILKYSWPAELFVYTPEMTARLSAAARMCTDMRPAGDISEGVGRLFSVKEGQLLQELYDRRMEFWEAGSQARELSEEFIDTFDDLDPGDAPASDPSLVAYDFLTDQAYHIYCAFKDSASPLKQIAEKDKSLNSYIARRITDVLTQHLYEDIVDEMLDRAIGRAVALSWPGFEKLPKLPNDQRIVVIKQGAPRTGKTSNDVARYDAALAALGADGAAVISQDRFDRVAWRDAGRTYPYCLYPTYWTNRQKAFGMANRRVAEMIAQGACTNLVYEVSDVDTLKGVPLGHGGAKVRRFIFTSSIRSSLRRDGIIDRTAADHVRNDRPLTHKRAMEYHNETSGQVIGQLAHAETPTPFTIVDTEGAEVTGSRVIASGETSRHAVIHDMQAIDRFCRVFRQPSDDRPAHAQLLELRDGFAAVVEDEPASAERLACFVGALLSHTSSISIEGRRGVPYVRSHTTVDGTTVLWVDTSHPAAHTAAAVIARTSMGQNGNVIVDRKTFDMITALDTQIRSMDSTMASMGTTRAKELLAFRAQGIGKTCINGAQEDGSTFSCRAAPYVPIYQRRQ